jgi:hypothetical protein
MLRQELKELPNRRCRPTWFESELLRLSVINFEIKNQDDNRMITTARCQPSTIHVYANFKVKIGEHY